MPDESKPTDPAAEQAAETLANMANSNAQAATVESDGEGDESDGDDHEPSGPAAGESSAAGEASSSKKKKKSKRKKLKEAIIGKPASAADAQAEIKKAIGKLSPNEIQDLIKLNPALGTELAAAQSSGEIDPAKMAELISKMDLQDIMTGLAASGKNAKDMASYKFWKTQPVPKFGEEEKKFEEGPLIPNQKVEDVPKEPDQLAIEGFEWVTMDLTDPVQMKEVYTLLNGHYVEDNEAMFRFNYSTALLKWALMSPGWKPEWHRGIRVGKTLCAFIAAIPLDIRVREKNIHMSEVNFMVVHKKLRNKRLAPVLIKEITRLCNLEGVWQAIYTGGVVLPRPVSTTRYYHRALDWQKLWEVGFSPLPPNSKPAFQVRKFSVPSHTSIKGLRAMKSKDVEAVGDLMQKYLQRFDLAPIWSREEVEHWLLPSTEEGLEQVIWSYVVEDAHGKITDFFSFYCLDSTVINPSRHNVVHAAYLFYYATDVATATPFDKDALKQRLNALMADAMVLAKQQKFDVFNAVSVMDNGLFLEQQKFGPGDGQLHYYLFNYRAHPIAGGVNKKNQLDENLSGVGFVML